MCPFAAGLLQLVAAMLAILVAPSGAGAASATSSTLYVGDGKGYEVAFKAEGEELYAIELAGTTHCYYTEPHKDIGSSDFSVFPAPKLMQRGPQGFVAEETGGDTFSVARAQVRAELSDGAVTGDFSYFTSEESFHCDTGFSDVSFQAFPYEPVGSAGAQGGPERRVYYGGESSIEVFLRATGKEARDIRGAFAPQCRLGRGRAIPARHALFDRPAFAELSEEGGFRQRVVQQGRTRSGAPYREVLSLTGSVEQEAIAGAYLRVRTTKSGRAPARRCVTGPIPFRAARYLPAAA